MSGTVVQRPSYTESLHLILYGVDQADPIKKQPSETGHQWVSH